MSQYRNYKINNFILYKIHKANTAESDDAARPIIQHKHIQVPVSELALKQEQSWQHQPNRKMQARTESSHTHMMLSEPAILRRYDPTCLYFPTVFDWNSEYLYRSDYANGGHERRIKVLMVLRVLWEKQAILTMTKKIGGFQISLNSPT